MQITSFIDKVSYAGTGEFAKLNPFTHDALHKVQSCDLMGVVLAIQSANKAFTEWKVSTLEQRLQSIRQLQKKLSQNSLQYAQLEALDQALPLWYVKKYSIEASLVLIDEMLAAPLIDSLSPVGVIAIIASWNLSLKIILQRLVPAVLAGNSVIVKVSSQSPVTCSILTELCMHLPVNIVVTDDMEAKRALIAHPGVKAVSFAGRLETSAEVIQTCNKSALHNFKKIQISSGSKNSAFVLGEPEDKIFSEVLNSFMIGQGQLAWNSARLFILEKNEQAWEDRLRDYLTGLKPSEGIEDTSSWTPCLKSSSFEKFSEIKKQAAEDQAKLLQTNYALSEKQKLSYLAPIFTKDMSRCSTLQQDQIHSPFYILSTVKYPFDVAKYSNVS